MKKHVERVLSKYSQKEIREESMHALAQHGSAESIFGLLQRFTFNHPDSIVDENEKHKVIQLLQHLGNEVSKEPLHRYLRDPRQAEISMALIALEKIDGAENTCKEIVSILDESDPEDVWTADRKLQLINHLDNYDYPETTPVLIRFLQDVNDDISFRCIELLEKIANDALIQEPLLQLCCNPQTGMRIRSRILDIVLARKWFLGPQRKELESLLPEGYYFDKRDHLKKRDNTPSA